MDWHPALRVGGPVGEHRRWHGEPRQPTHTWRLWDGVHWLAFNYDQSLNADTWYSLALTGDIVGNQVHYQQLAVGGSAFALGQTYAPVAEATPPKLAVATQIDGDGAMNPQTLYLDGVGFQAVPEPGTAATVAGGLGLLGFGAWRRLRAA